MFPLCWFIYHKRVAYYYSQLSELLYLQGRRIYSSYFASVFTHKFSCSQTPNKDYVDKERGNLREEITQEILLSLNEFKTAGLELL